MVSVKINNGGTLVDSGILNNKDVF